MLCTENGFQWSQLQKKKYIHNNEMTVRIGKTVRLRKTTKKKKKEMV